MVVPDDDDDDDALLTGCITHEESARSLRPTRPYHRTCRFVLFRRPPNRLIIAL